VRRSVFITLACCALLGAQQPAQWEISYFFDVANAAMALSEIRFADATHGVAIGTLNEQGRRKSVAVVTSDGGLNWTQSALPDDAVSLFFLNPSLGWMVGENGLWVTRDAGRTYQIVYRRKGLRSVWFLNDKHGFAVGSKGGFWETTDGGVRWSNAAQSRKLKLDKNIELTRISFQGSQAIIGGAFLFPAQPYAPPPPARNAVLLFSHDTGATWRFSTTAMPARVLRASVDRDSAYVLLSGTSGRGAGRTAILYRINERNSRVLYRGDLRQPTDFVRSASGQMWLGTYEPAGSGPGKVVILRSPNDQTWTEVPTDYRAVARRISLAEAPGGAMWAVTDTGMILTLR